MPAEQSLPHAPLPADPSTHNRVFCLGGLPAADRSHKRNHTPCGLLCLASR